MRKAIKRAALGAVAAVALGIGAFGVGAITETPKAEAAILICGPSGTNCTITNNYSSQNIRFQFRYNTGN